jgi:hypothetical protein
MPCTEVHLLNSLVKPYGRIALNAKTLDETDLDQTVVMIKTSIKYSSTLVEPHPCIQGVAEGLLPGKWRQATDACGPDSWDHMHPFLSLPIFIRR